AGAGLGFEAGQPICGNRRRVEKRHRPAVRLALFLGEFQQVDGAFDVDLVGRRRREFAARREQGGEVEDEVDFIFGEHAVEQLGVEDRANVLLPDERYKLGGEGVEVQCDD